MPLWGFCCSYGALLLLWGFVAPMRLYCSYEALLVVEALIADVEDGARRRQLPQAAQGLTFLESLKI